MVQLNLYIYMQHWFKHILFNKNMARHYAKVSAVCNIESSLCKFLAPLCHLAAELFKCRPFKGLCLINGASYDQSLYEIHIVSHIWPFSLPYNI